MDHVEECVVGLRVDVDTYRGTRDGVPRLLELLVSRGVRATFFFSVGPDNMGRHLWRLLKPEFLAKMLRSNAPNLYGWDILLRGTVWPGPRIAERLGRMMLATKRLDHEVGLHAWDHHHWQTCAGHMSRSEVEDDVRRGMDALTEALETPVGCSAAAGWQCTDDVLRAKETFGFRYNSDCRGTSVFRPVLDGTALTPQIPVTLPTYDELVGRDGIRLDTYNDHLLSLIRPRQLNVLTIHAEVEGISRHGLFCDFLEKGLSRGLVFAPLGDLLGELENIPHGSISSGAFPGREGHLCHQVVAASS